MAEDKKSKEIERNQTATDTKIGIAEYDVLGAMFKGGPSTILLVSNILKPEDFKSARHQLIYREILKQLVDEGKEPTKHSICQALKKSGKLEYGDIEYIESLEHFTTAYVEKDARTVKEHANHRKFITSAQQILKSADGRKLNDVIADYDKLIKDVTENSADSNYTTQSTYFAQFFDEDVDAAKKYSTRTTGFSNIDLKQNFVPGLYVLGATPACGKTTFAWQLLSQLADHGEHCIFCSYEMSRFELYTKTLARELFKKNRNITLTAADIRRGRTFNWGFELQTLVNELSGFKAEQRGVYVLELNDESVDDLLKLLKPRLQVYGRKKRQSIIVIDYLQIISPANATFYTDKSKIDDIVHKLKNFQRETDATVILISSLNRMNYFQQVSFESFKDSGNIEYTADVVWAMQMNIANFIQQGTAISEVRNKFDIAKKQQPREIQLKCLKNRQGNNYDCFFQYFSAHDFFEPCNISDFQGTDDFAASRDNNRKTF